MTHLLDGWLVEQHIDPDWYSEHGEMTVGPPPELQPGVHELHGEQQTVGRRSASRGTMPDVDCTPDTGVSRNHAGFTADSGRLFVEDLGSANGTFVARAGEQIPQVPIPVGRQVELLSGDRVYVGAWTRLDIRRLDTGEEEATTMFAPSYDDDATQIQQTTSRWPSASEDQWG